MSLYEQLDTLVNAGEPVVLLTIVGKEGSTPREVGAKMLVTNSETHGTIGGGTVEGLAIDDAHAVLDGEAEPGTRTYDLYPGGNTGMVCGGSMDVFIDLVRGAKHLYIAGGGHIAAELAPLAENMGYEVSVIDDREEYADPERYSETTQTRHGGYDEELRDLSMTEETAVVVATRSGTFDQHAVGAALDGGAGYVGLVASDTKTRHVLDSLAEDGYERHALAHVRAPVGLDIGGGRPEDVALSILSEMHCDHHNASGERHSQLDLDDLVVVRGGGDLGSGVVHRLHRAGFPVIVTEVEKPTVVRRAVAFASAMYEDGIEIEGVTGRRATTTDEVIEILADGSVPVLDDSNAHIADTLGAGVLVDAIMAKGKFDTGTRQNDAGVVIGLGPGFDPGDNVDAVIETDRGHELGRVIYEGTASEYDGEPGERRGYTHERVLRAPTAGVWTPSVEIGEYVAEGQGLGSVGKEPVKSEIDGLVRGLVHAGVEVDSGTKLGDVDPRDGVDHTKISDKALCLGGGVLEAVMALR